MKQMNGAMRRLRDQIGDASKKEDNLKLIGDMERGAVAAKNATPKKLRDVPEAERPAKAEKFRRDLITLTRKLLDIEQNIMDGKNDAAKKGLEELTKIRDEEHKYFGVDDED
jgi:soluble cytochrome b562